jgi:hypothetical protein
MLRSRYAWNDRMERVTQGESERAERREVQQRAEEEAEGGSDGEEEDSKQRMKELGVTHVSSFVSNKRERQYASVDLVGRQLSGHQLEEHHRKETMEKFVQEDKAGFVTHAW